MVTRRLLIAWAAIVACGDGLGPGNGKPIPQPGPGPTTTVTFRVCSDLVPQSVALLTGNGVVTPSVNSAGQFTAAVTEKVGLRYLVDYAQHHPHTALRVIYMTAGELAELDCGLAIGREHIFTDGRPATANPRYAWVRATGVVNSNVSVGAATNAVNNGQVTRIGGFPAGTLDLIASATRDGETRPRVVLRRDIAPTNNDTIPTIDFASPEAVLLEEFPLSVPGISTCTTTLHGGTTDHSFPPSSQLPAVPVSFLRPSELHQLRCFASSFALFHYFRQGSATALVGPVGQNPQPVKLPEHAVRITVESGNGYPDVVGVTFSLPANLSFPTHGTRDTEVLVTKKYLDEIPGDLVFEIPAFAEGDRAGQSTVRSIRVEGRPAVYLGGRANAGETVYVRTSAP